MADQHDRPLVRWATNEAMYGASIATPRSRFGGVSTGKPWPRAHSAEPAARGGIDAPYVASFVAQRTSGPVVLVGHSYGGFVITNATGGGDVRALVYVDAFVPDEGETVFQILGGPARRSPSPTRPRCSTSSATRAHLRATSKPS